MTELRVSRLWRYGPDWLRDGSPLSKVGNPTEMPDECYKELKINSKKTHNLVVTKAKPTIGEIMACEKFNSFRRLVSHGLCHKGSQGVQEKGRQSRQSSTLH